MSLTFGQHFTQNLIGDRLQAFIQGFVELLKQLSAWLNHLIRLIQMGNEYEWKNVRRTAMVWKLLQPESLNPI